MQGEKKESCKPFSTLGCGRCRFAEGCGGFRGGLLHIVLLCLGTALLSPGSPGEVKPFHPAGPGEVSYLVLGEADAAWSDREQESKMRKEK